MNGRLPTLIKSLLPTPHWRRIRRAANRLRWIQKASLVRQYGFPVRQRPLTALKYILWDPEVESFSYEISNAAEYARYIAPVLDVTPDQVMKWIREAQTDPYLTRDRGFHWSFKRRQPLGNRTMWYPIVRALKPRLIVEAGIHEGLGSEMFLCALKRNNEEGYPGTLISFDVFEDTGTLVHPDLRGNWQRVIKATPDAMVPVLQDREVDLFLHETLHTPELIGGELDVVLEHAGPRLGVIDSSGLLNTTLREYCQRHDARHHHFFDQPVDHVVKSHGTSFAIFERARVNEEEQTRLATQSVIQAIMVLSLYLQPSVDAAFALAGC